MSLDKETLQTLRGKLKKGDQTRIAKKLKFSPDYVNMVLNSKRHNDDVIDMAIEIAKKRAESKKSRTRQINNL